LHSPADAYALLSRSENTDWVFQKSKVWGTIWNYEGGRDSRMETISQ